MSDKRYYVYADSSIEADALALIHDYTQDITPLANPIKSDTIKWRVFLKKEGDIKHLDYVLEEIGAYLSPERIIEFESETGECPFDVSKFLILDEGVKTANYGVETTVTPDGGAFLSGCIIEMDFKGLDTDWGYIDLDIFSASHEAGDKRCEIQVNNGALGPMLDLDVYAMCTVDYNFDNMENQLYSVINPTLSDEKPLISMLYLKKDFISTETDIWIDVTFTGNCKHDSCKVYFVYDTEKQLSFVERLEPYMHF